MTLCGKSNALIFPSCLSFFHSLYLTICWKVQINPSFFHFVIELRERQREFTRLQRCEIVYTLQEALAASDYNLI